MCLYGKLKMNDSAYKIVMVLIRKQCVMSRQGKTSNKHKHICMHTNRHTYIHVHVMHSLWKLLWCHSSVLLKMKVYIFNASVLSVLLCCADTRVLKLLAKKINSSCRSLRTIENIRWYHYIFNEEPCACTYQLLASHLIDIHCTC